MPKYAIDLKDGTTQTIEAESPQAAGQMQAELNAAIVNAKTGPPRTPDTFGQNILDVGGEFASAANRATMQGLDFLTSPLQWLDNATGDRLPTFEGAYGQTPGASGGFMDKGTPRDMVRGAGGAAPAAFGFFPVAGRNLASPAGATLDFMGLGAAKPQSSVAPFSFGSQNSLSPAFALPGEVPPATVAPKTPLLPLLNPRSDELFQTQGRVQAGRLSEAGSDSVERFGRKVDPYTGRTVKDPQAVEVAKQGVPKGIVSTVQAANDSTKGKLVEMLDIVDESKNSAKFSITNRPLDIAGDSLSGRFRVVQNVNKNSGAQLDDIAKSLKGEQVDPGPAFGGFFEKLEQMGVKINKTEDGLEIGDIGSDIQGLDAPVNALQRLVNRIQASERMDAYELHKIKKFIDENVTYGKSKDGLAGKTESVIKGLRRDIDSLLDNQFPQYDKVNSEYAETRGILDEVKRLVASGSDETSVNFEKGLGTLLRRVLSNARSREPMLDLVSALDATAKKYAKTGKEVGPYAPSKLFAETPVDLDDDILTQVLFADELDRLFGTNARTSLLGDASKAVDRGMETLGRGRTMTDFAVEGGQWALDKARGVNEENAMKALREMLNASK